MDNIAEDKAIVRRLMVVRSLVVDDNQAEFARLLGINRSRWNNFECGFPLTMRMARLMVSKVPGLSIDYLVYGKTGNLTVSLANQLRDRELQLFSRRSNNKPSKT